MLVIKKEHTFMPAALLKWPIRAMIAFIIMDLLGSTEASKTVRISITLYL
jgi:hypothetical protein